MMHNMGITYNTSSTEVCDCLEDDKSSCLVIKCTMELFIVGLKFQKEPCKELYH